MREETWAEMRERHERERVEREARYAREDRAMRRALIAGGLGLLLLIASIPVISTACTVYACDDTCAALGGWCADALPYPVCEMPDGRRILLHAVRENRGER